MCRTTLTRIALESTDAGASNSESNIRIGPLGVDLITFELAELLKYYDLLSTFLPITNPITGLSGDFKSDEVDSMWSESDL